MAPPPAPSEQPDTAAVGVAEAGLISKVLIVMAMEVEVMPLVHNFKLVEAPAHESTFPKGAPWLRYHGNYKGLHIDLVQLRKDTVYGVDSVGTVPAALLTYSSVQTLKPNLTVNAGTAGGFNAKGARVGNVYLASDVAFHDKRIPIPARKLSTRNSLYMSPKDEEVMRRNDDTINDMEGTAVAYVADMFSIPTMFVKAVANIVDGEKPTEEEFLMNLITVTRRLEQAVVKVIDFISGKRLSDL